MGDKKKIIHIDNLPSIFKGKYRNNRFVQTGNPPIGLPFDKVSNLTGLLRLGSEFISSPTNTLYNPDGNKSIIIDKAKDAIDWYNKPGPSFPYNLMKQEVYQTDDGTIGRKTFANGGKTNKIPNVVDGGIAQPLGNNFFYMNGRKHSQGGIDIGPSDKTGIEVEDGEIIETNGNELKVYSAQPIINGVSPAKLVMSGANPNKVFAAQEQYKDNNRINDDGTRKKQIGGEVKPKFDDWYKTVPAEINDTTNYNLRRAYELLPYNELENWRNGKEHLRSVAPTKDGNYEFLKSKKHPTYKYEIDWYNSPDATSFRKEYLLDESTEYPTYRKRNKMGGLSRSKDYGSKKKPYPSVNKKDFAGDGRSYPIPTKVDAIDALRLAGLHGRNDVKAKVYNKYPELRKKGSNGLIVSISGNVKNGLLHSPSSTGSRIDKLRAGGKRINRDGRTWEYNEEFGAYVPITNRSISRTSAYPIDKSARGETVRGNEYTFKNGRWRKNDKIDSNTTVRDIDNGNRRPQYYAERELPLFNDGAGITSGLVRAGWSHGNNNKKYNVDNINIPNVPNVSITKSKGQTPRRGQSKQNQSVQSTQVNTPPVAIYNRNLPKVKADIPTTLPVSTRNPIQGTISSDGRGQGKFKNITTADWIGLGSNIAGSLASYFSSRSALNKMRSPSQPMLISANKLKTKYNINPQLDRIREDKFASYRDIDSNTASSRVGLARKQRVRNAAGQAVNELYGNKENIETNLINQDRRNQQSVRQFNAQQYNQYLDRKTAFDNGIREAKVTNINNLFSGINAGIQDMISRYENRKALNNTIGAMRASAPNVDDRIMRDAGVDYDEFIIRKRRKLGGKQSCR